MIFANYQFLKMHGFADSFLLLFRFVWCLNAKLCADVNLAFKTMNEAICNVTDKANHFLFIEVECS